MFDAKCVHGAGPGALHVLNQPQVTSESSPNSANEALKQSNKVRTHIVEESHNTVKVCVKLVFFPLGLLVHDRF